MEHYEFYTYEDMKKAEEKGVSASTFKQRIETYGYSVDEAINKPVRKQKKYNQEMMKKAEEKGVSNEAYRYRINSGYTEEEAINTPVFSRSESGKKGRKGVRKFTDEQLEIMKQKNIPIGTARQRVNAYGMTIEEAITKPINTRRIRQT